MMSGLARNLPPALLLIFLSAKIGEADLTPSYYTATCPKVESIVQQAVAAKFGETTSAAPATLQLFFHDCFVQGCDGSILIQSSYKDAEIDAIDNKLLSGVGFDTVIRAKQAVEAACPGVVSCADILAIAARDVVVITGGPTFEVELGRLDGKRSSALDVPGELPLPTFKLQQIVDMFAKHNLTMPDAVALLGAHTIGVAHCSRVFNRLYNFPSSNGVDPDLDPAYAEKLKQACPQNVDPSKVIPLDDFSPLIFDSWYYINLVAKKGLLTADEVLFTDDTSSKALVVDWAENTMNFFSAFTQAMIKLGRVDVKTASMGEIRLDCSKFNS